MNSDTPNPESSTPGNNANRENNTQYVKKYRRLRTIWTVEVCSLSYDRGRIR